MTNPQALQPPRVSKGVLLELRIARLLLAQGISPFLDVYFRSREEAAGVSVPDVDVLGCVVLPDATMLHSHVDCKSGDSSVLNRVLLLQGLRRRMPPGPILYVRPNTKLDLKRLALGEDIRIADVSEISDRERRLVGPLFGDNFPTICSPETVGTHSKIRARTKKHQLGRILLYLQTEFWMEPPFTRLKRCIAAAQLADNASAEAGLSLAEQALVLGQIFRHLVYAVLQATYRVAYFGNAELELAIGRWLVTEAVPVEEYRTIVESTAQLIFDTYGDPSRGPLRPQDYEVSPPDYVQELARIIQNTATASTALPAILPTFDAELIERGLAGRPQMAERMLKRCPAEQVEAAKVWLRGLRLFLVGRKDSLGGWRGWAPIA